MKKAIKAGLSLALVICMFLSMIPATAAASTLPFTDVKENLWYYDSVKYVYDNGLMIGIAPEKFAPNATLTRAMLVTVLWRMSGSPAAGTSSFKDVPKDTWYSTAVAWAEENSIVMGYNGETFGPTDKITREQMAAMFYRYANAVSKDTSVTANMTKYKDSSTVSNWAKPAVKWAIAVGLIKGVADNKLSPLGKATRSQVATTLMRFCESISKPQKRFTLKYYMNDGTDHVYKTILAPANEFATAPEAPTREGYTFIGWYEKANYTDIYNFDLLVTENANLYAGWYAPGPYTVTFDSNGGTAISAQTIDEGGTILEPEDPKNEGNLFLGWCDEADEYFDFEDPCQRDIALTAVWLPLSELDISPEDLPEEAVTQPLDTESGIIISAEATARMAGTGKIVAQQVKTGPSTSIPGFLAAANFDTLGASGSDATVTFNYDTEKLAAAGLSPDELAIVWYDEENDVAVKLDNCTVDESNHSISAKPGHFSLYVIVRDIDWTTAQNTQLPALRTEEVPYYNIVLAMDDSGSMSSAGKMEKSIEAAQKMIDVLDDNDRVTLLAFSDRIAEVFSQVQLVSDSERDYVKTQISRLSASGSSTDIAGVLKSCLKYKSNDAQYQSLVILLSDGKITGGGTVTDSLLEDLKENGQRVISVGLGSDVDEVLMQRIANQTGGSYLHCENAGDLATAFEDLQEAYIGSTKDTDGDGLPDLVETTGMRDQYGEIYVTDPNNPDSDGDGISDGKEMGSYVSPVGQAPFFHRVSRPDMYTVKSDEAYLLVPENFIYAVDEDENTIRLELYVDASGYRMVPDLLMPPDPDGIPKEYIYSEPVNLTVELTNLPQGATIKSINTVKLEKGNTTARAYKTTALLSYTKDITFGKVLWTVRADNCSEWSAYAENGIFAKYVEKQQSVSDTKIEIKNCARWEQNLAEQSRKLCKSLFKNAEKDITQQKDNALLIIKQQIQLRPGYEFGSTTDLNNLPNEVYEAFALGIYEALDGSKLKKYETNMSKLVNQISGQIKAGVKRIDENVKPEGSSITYHVHGDIITQDSKGNAWVYIDWTNNGNHQVIFTWTNVFGNDQDLRDYIAPYCAALAELNKGVWYDFLAYYTSDLAGVMGITLSADSAKSVLEKTEKVINALCSKKAADDLVNEMGAKAKEQLKQLIGNGFKKFVINNIPYGKQLQEAAKLYKQAREQFDKYEKLKTADSETQFIAAYNELTKLLREIDPTP